MKTKPYILYIYVHLYYLELKCHSRKMPSDKLIQHFHPQLFQCLKDKEVRVIEMLSSKPRHQIWLRSEALWW